MDCHDAWVKEEDVRGLRNVGKILVEADAIAVVVGTEYVSSRTSHRLPTASDSSCRVRLRVTCVSCTKHFSLHVPLPALHPPAALIPTRSGTCWSHEIRGGGARELLRRVRGSSRSELLRHIQHPGSDRQVLTTIYRMQSIRMARRSDNLDQDVLTECRHQTIGGVVKSQYHPPTGGAVPRHKYRC